jgi:hypothetical protein
MLKVKDRAGTPETLRQPRTDRSGHCCGYFKPVEHQLQDPNTTQLMTQMGRSRPIVSAKLFLGIHDSATLSILHSIETFKHTYNQNGGDGELFKSHTVNRNRPRQTQTLKLTEELQNNTIF